MKSYYNPLSREFKSIRGGIREDEHLTIKVNSDEESLSLYLTDEKNDKTDIYDMEKGDGYFTITLPLLTPGLHWYFFEGKISRYGKGKNLILKAGEYVDKYQLLVYKKTYKTPKHLEGGIIYQIFPDRFKRVGKIPKTNRKMKKWNELPDYLPDEHGRILNNDFFGGNLKGIESKLDYLKGLGVTIIYLNPIALAASHHRYDTSDYMKIDTLLGNDEDLTSLCNEAHKRGISIILDGVYNHTGDDSVYFNKYGHFDNLGAYQSKKSPYYSWYTFTRFPNIYNSWWGIDTLPTISKESREFENFISGKNGVLEHYLDLGVDGYRLDVVDELPSDFVKKIRKTIKRKKRDSLLIGEVWEDATNKIAYDVRKEYFLGAELDSVMNYPIKGGILNYVWTKDQSYLTETILNEVNNYPKDALNMLMNILGTHDTERILTMVGTSNHPWDRVGMSKAKLSKEEYDRGKKMLKICVGLEYTLPGIPTIYYGDEIGMEGEKDPFNRKPFPWGTKDSEIFNFYKKMAKVREENVFKEGDINILVSEGGTLIYERIDEKERVIVAVNLSSTFYRIKGDLFDLINRKRVKNVTLEKNKIYILKDLGY